MGVLDRLIIGHVCVPVRSRRNRGVLCALFVPVPWNGTLAWPCPWGVSICTFATQASIQVGGHAGLTYLTAGVMLPGGFLIDGKIGQPSELRSLQEVAHYNKAQVQMRWAGLLPRTLADHGRPATLL